MNTIRVLHLSPTDIRYDSRILKELKSIAKMTDYNVCGIGIASDKAAKIYKQEQNFTVITLHLVTGALKIFPRPILYALTMTEMTVRLILNSIRHHPNIVHCHDTMTLPAGVFVKFITGAKLVYDAHELESNKNGQTKILSKATFLIEKRCWPKIDHLITVSNSIISWYEKNIGVKSNSLILNSPMINRVDSVPNKYFHKLYNIPLNKFVFAYLGILGHGRGIDYILETFCSENIESHIVFIGYGELEKKIREISLQRNNIHLHASVPHEDVVSVVKNADIGLCLIENVSLSDYYCLPNKLFEYTFAGIPVLASNFPDIREIVEEYELGKCCDFDHLSIAHAIVGLENNMPKRITTDLTKLGWQAQAEKLVGVYKRLIL
jgi:glycosyltransferase involved in cell wall biosynthesis